MTPEQRFNRWVQVALVVFVLAFVYFIIADTHMPLTPEGRLLRLVTPVAPQVSGRVTEVAVHNNQHVEKGALLYRIDDRPYQLALAQAQLNLEQAQRENRMLDAQIASARAELSAARSTAANSLHDLQRYRSLAGQNSISRQVRDQADARYQSDNATVEAKQAALEQLRANRGEAGRNNLRLRQAENAVSTAQLNLKYTQVRADTAGVITNLQLSPGDYAATGSATLALVGDIPDLTADFREKSLRTSAEGTQAAVVFDGLPGQVFKAHLSARDAGVKDGQYMADGTLAAPVKSDRWVRDAQRMRVHLVLDEWPATPLSTGARATVQLYPGGNPVAHLFGAVQIRFVSWVHYVY